MGATFSFVAHSSDFNPASHIVDSVVADSCLVVSVPVVSWDIFVPVINFPARYCDFLHVFEKQNAYRLMTHCPNDCPIELQDGTHPPFRPIYGLFEPELEALRTYLDENLLYVKTFKAS